MVRATFPILTLILSTAVTAVSAAVPHTPATQPATQPTSRPATTINAEILKAVELAQQALRAPKLPAPPPARNMLQKKDRADMPKPDVLTPIAGPLTGKSGLVGFQVVDVARNDGRTAFTNQPIEVYSQRGQIAYIVAGECDNPTAIFYTDSERHMLQLYTAAGNQREVAQIRSDATRHRPPHRVWLLTDDPAVEKWGKGDRRSIQATVTSATLRLIPYGYVVADVVVRPANTPPAP